MDSKSKRNLIVLVVALAGAIALCGGFVYLLAGDQLVDTARDVVLRIRLAPYQDELETPISDDESVIRFNVPPGSSASAIGNKLETEGIITDAGLFADYAQVEGLASDLDAGIFFINRSMSIKEIANALTTASFSQITFTVTPGQRLEEIAAAIDAAQPYFAFPGDAFLEVVSSGAPIPPDFAASNAIPPGASLEGFLLPDTYTLDPEVTPLGLRDRLLARFQESITPEMRNQAAEDGYSMYEVVTLASIVEREAIYADEYRTIASVYRNRLEMEDDGLETLDADPTVQYGHPDSGPGNWWPQITASDYRTVNSAYNTYINRGLPPGPIAQPSLSAIEATISPLDTPYLFFRADCRDDNRHDFFTNYEDHRDAC